MLKKMKKFKLINELKYDITRSACDMAALFNWSNDQSAEDVLKISCTDRCISAVLYTGDTAVKSTDLKMREDVSGEASRAVKLAVIDLFSQLEHKKIALPWGILTGVRPGKLAHKLLDSGITPEALPDIFNRDYLVPYEQGQLLKNICLIQRKVLPDKSAAGIYIGIPYCPSKCSYCSFPSGIIPPDVESQENFLNFIEQDVMNVVQLIGVHGLNIMSIYIGGGTPTSFADSVFARLMNIVEKNLLSASVSEFTVEAGRPDCFTVNKLRAMEDAGVNRISVNPQTFSDKTLALIGRKHTVDEFYKAYAMAEKSSIPVINTDLIIGLPQETEADILNSFESVKRLCPQNLTVHTLTMKRNAELFGSDYSLNSMQAEKMVSAAFATAESMGMHPYYLYRQHYMIGHLANIGYALPGTESIYNIQMMEERHTVIGIGPSSATKVPMSDGHHLKKLNMPKNINYYTQNLQQLAAQRAGLFIK